MGKTPNRDSRGGAPLETEATLSRKQMFLRLLEITSREDLPVAKLQKILQAAERIAAEPDDEPAPRTEVEVRG